jgi:hypothetical protein
MNEQPPQINTSVNPDPTVPPSAALPNEERPHHPYSPSSLQYLEACALFKSRSDANARAVAGTIGHNVVDTGEDDDRLSDKDAAAAADCLELVAERKALMQEAAKRAFDSELQTYWNTSGGPNPPVPPDPSKFQVTELKEIYLPVDDREFDDCKSTTAGYVDLCLINHDFTYAELLDWKFGMWAVESADKNLQGIAYSLGLFKKYPTIKEILFTFKQPHLNLVTSHKFTRANIADLYLRVQAVVAKARVARKSVKEKNDWTLATPRVPCCNFCANLGTCPRGLEFACKVSHKFLPLEFPEDVDPMKIMDPHNTQLALRLAAVMKIWADAFKSRVTDRVLSRQCDAPEGYCIQERDGRRKIAVTWPSCGSARAA